MAAASSAPRLRSKRLRRCLHLLHSKESNSSARHAHHDNSSNSTDTTSPHHIKRRTVAHDAVSAGAASGTTASGDSSFSSTGVDDDDECNSVALDSPTTPILMHALSNSDVLSHDSHNHVNIPQRRSTDSIDSSRSSSSSSESSRYSTKRKGVKYSRNGAVVCCRFCDILRARAEDFLYEDDLVSVFRPLAPVVASHILVVPRHHIRNVNMLTTDHLELLARMKTVAAMVLQHVLPLSTNDMDGHNSSSATGSAVQLDDDAEFKFAFHTPPFNSIDHVHMHAFRRNESSAFGCFGAIKYRTETWWCRSFDQVVRRLGGSSAEPTTRRQRPLLEARRGSLNSAMSSSVCVST